MQDDSLFNWSIEGHEDQETLRKSLEAGSRDLVKHDNFLELHGYTGASKSLNRELISRARGHAPSTHYNYDINALDKIISDHKIKTPMDVYHIAGFDAGTMADANPDRIIHLPSYTSTSVTRKHVYNNAFQATTPGSLLHIHLPAGHEGVYIGKHSQYDGENEMLLPRDMKLKISKEKETYHAPSLVGTHVVHLWHAHPVTNDE